MLKGLTINIILLVSVLGAQSARVDMEKTSQGFEGTVRTELNVKPRGLLEIESLTGDLILDGTDQNQFLCLESFRVKTRNTGRAENIVAEHRAIIKKNNQGTTIQRNKHSRDYSSYYEIKIPRNYSVDAVCKSGDVTAINLIGNFEMKTLGGDAEISQLKGEINIQASGGDVNLDNCNGPIQIKVQGGDLDLEEIEGVVTVRNSGGSIDLESMKGSGTIKNQGGNINLNTLEGGHLTVENSGGNITIGNSNMDIRASNSGSKIHINKANGDLDLNTLGGAIAVGALEGNLKSEAKGGDIKLGNISGSLNATIKGGDLSVKSVHGNLEAENKGGDITVDKAYSNVSATSSGGDIQITKYNNKNSNLNNVNLTGKGGNLTCYLEKSISAQINAQIKMKRNRYNIISDFDLDIEKQRSFGRYIWQGKGTLKNGQALIELQTNEGDIVIKKVINK
ncbi:MAG TPA: hypothetical protein VKP78_10845 [bacterium]|nr:hypothetical protein [bacterium]